MEAVGATRREEIQDDPRSYSAFQKLQRGRVNLLPKLNVTHLGQEPYGWAQGANLA